MQNARKHKQLLFGKQIYGYFLQASNIGKHNGTVWMQIGNGRRVVPVSASSSWHFWKSAAHIGGFLFLVMMIIRWIGINIHNTLSDIFGKQAGHDGRGFHRLFIDHSVAMMDQAIIGDKDKRRKYKYRHQNKSKYPRSIGKIFILQFLTRIETNVVETLSFVILVHIRLADNSVKASLLLQMIILWIVQITRSGERIDGK